MAWQRPCTAGLLWSASTRRYPPRSAPGHIFQPGALIVPEITSIVRRPLTGRRRGSR
jgi:hypothetical protein